MGRPDLTLLEEKCEKGDKFYELQFNDKDIDIPFRETESQQRSEQHIMRESLRREAADFYDSFMF